MPRRHAQHLCCARVRWAGANDGGARVENDAEADMPKPKRTRAQYAFKNSMIHGILQFTLPIALCCVLHRCGSQEIHCTVLMWFVS